MVCCVSRALDGVAVRLAQHCLAGVPSTAQALVVTLLAERTPSVRQLLGTLVPACLAAAGAAPLLSDVACSCSFSWIV